MTGISEHEEQKALIKAWNAYAALHGIDEKLLFAIPNGGKRNVITARVMKSEGVRAGVPDLFLALPRGGYHGLFIEMKKEKGGVVSDEQKEYIKILRENGYDAGVCHGYKEALAAVIQYLE